MTYKTEQEIFWAGEFGSEYLNRNRGDKTIKSNLNLFSKVLNNIPKIHSIVELGCNIGLNLSALHEVDADFELAGYEINHKAADEARQLNIAEIHEQTIIDNLQSDKKYDLSFTKGVLIHIEPDSLNNVYENLYNLSKRYILVCEYYNPTPVSIDYRGHKNKLFKRDFAGELMTRYDLNLVDYGFVYHKDNYFPQDDCTWFLLEKKNV